MSPVDTRSRDKSRRLQLVRKKGITPTEWAAVIRVFARNKRLQAKWGVPKVKVDPL